MVFFPPLAILLGKQKVWQYDFVSGGAKGNSPVSFTRHHGGAKIYSNKIKWG